MRRVGGEKEREGERGGEKVAALSLLVVVVVVVVVNVSG